MSARVVSAGTALGIKLWSDMVADFEEVGEASLAERGEISEEFREGLSFRNTAAEYLERVQAMGPQAFAAFTACMTDYVSITAQGSSCESGHYPPTPSFTRRVERALSGVPAPPASDAAA